MLTQGGFASHPVVVKVGGEYFCRGVRGINDDGSLVFACAIDDGVVLTLAEARGMVETTRRKLDELESRLSGIDMVLGFDCAYRRIDAENRQVVRKMSDLYREHHVLGFSTYGEQYQSMHLNQTLTGIAFGRPARGAARRGRRIEASAGKMPIRHIDDLEKLRRINEALVSRVERSMEQQGNAFTLFQTAINLENRVRARTEELRATLRHLEQSNLELIAAKENAEQANLSKTRFLAAASHDILQPLNAAHLSISALAELQGSEEGRTLARQVERSLETMEDLLRTLLDISKLDAGVVEPEIGDVALEPLFSSLSSDFKPFAENKGLRLSFRPTHAVVRSDRTLLRRILQNIISNAIRYTRKGGVLVGVRHRGETIRIDVVDTGRGIPPRSAARGVRGVPPRQRGRRRRAVGRARARPGDRQAHGRRARPSRRLLLGDGFRAPSSMSRCPPHGPAYRARRTVCRARPAARLRPFRHQGAAGRERRSGARGDARAARALALRGAGRDFDRRGHRGAFRCRWFPDIIIADQHLDHGDLGSTTIGQAREALKRAVPALIITADASEVLARAARASGIELMRKPVKPAELRALLAHLLA